MTSNGRRNPAHPALGAACAAPPGFRPFLPGGGGLGARGSLSSGLPPGWLGSDLPTAFDPVDCTPMRCSSASSAAAVAGFLLTAIPNWTGRLPLQGLPAGPPWPALWLAGRLAIYTSASIGARCRPPVDLAFPALLLAVVLREIPAGRNWRNLPVCRARARHCSPPTCSTHLAAARHRGHGAARPAPGQRHPHPLIALIGGRIIPSFTPNPCAAAARRHGPSRHLFARFDEQSWRPASRSPVRRLGRGAGAGVVTGALLVVAGLGHGIRLVRWQPLATRGEPLLWVLHLGYALLALGLPCCWVR